jgi:hypothetical protein
VNLTVLVPTTTTPLTGPFAVMAGNADNSFSPVTGAFTAPATGVYEATFTGSFNNITALAVVKAQNNFYYVNGVAKVNNIVSGSFTAGSNTLFTLTSIFSLTQGDILQIYSTSTLAGLAFTSNVQPASAQTVFSVKSLF